ncbi:hypothetical protein [Pseudonocardia humida]|uniref:Uncharacterized protein n=1 Tax=Pseudonocardia humida TaxID=2800819 RepID=A0ABT1A5G5_9PSEU|nr:hypothetical protein [Pseudonocardia humida]MCO1658262.1 hypothetical protein [Pseudonocardia humida]
MWLAPVPGPYPAAVALVVLAVQTVLCSTDFRTTRRNLLFRLVVAGLRLWAVSWRSSYMVVTLHIAGFWTFALVSLLLVGAFTAIAEGTWRLLGPPPPPQDAIDPRGPTPDGDRS